jgi:transposase, IS5 family
LTKRGKILKPVEFGHKVFLAKSLKELITQYCMLDGNSTDDTNAESSLKYNQKIFGQALSIYSVDRGGFSRSIVEKCKNSGVEHVCIPQRGGKRTPDWETFEKSPKYQRWDEKIWTAAKTKNEKP